MKLAPASIQWSINHLFRESDNDLFPRPFELSIVKSLEVDVIDQCKEIDITNYKWKSSRRFLVPKDNVSFRNATQLDLIDSILIGAIFFEYGDLIEQKRIPENQHITFSYRFKPTADGTLYSNTNAWEAFWESSQKKAKDFSHVVVCDISDFYNQISLHTIENQLETCGIPAPICRRIKELIVSITQRNSKGIPIGPHISHLIAELSLIPFDNQLQFRDIEFKRYVDDIIVFCNSDKEARIRLNQIAEILDKEQRLVLQKSKTQILEQEEFIDLCKTNLLDDIEYNEEEEIINIIQKHSGGNAYSKINLSDISNEDMAKLTPENIIALFEEYLLGPTPNYEKLRWLYRRMAQIGIPHAIDFSLEHFDKLIPALNDVCLYINSCAENYKSDWKDVGEWVLNILEDEIIDSNEFYKITLYNLFVYNKHLNHIAALTDEFQKVSENIKRKILLASMHYNSEGWLRSLKESSPKFESWTKRAYLIAASKLPREEREYFYKGIKPSLLQSDILEHTIIKWGISQ